MDTQKKELNLEEMENVTGGYVVDDGTGEKFWIVRQDGTVYAPVPTKEQAIEFAKSLNVSPTVKTLDEYKKIFGRDLKW